MENETDVKAHTDDGPKGNDDDTEEEEVVVDAMTNPNNGANRTEPDGFLIVQRILMALVQLGCWQDLFCLHFVFGIYFGTSQ